MTIRQAELERLRRLRQQQAQAKDEYQALRAELLERYREGIPVEPGPWDLRIDENEYRHFSREQLERILGTRETDRLYEQLIPKKIPTVIVVESRRRRSR